MYCSSCGTAVTPNLSYCNRCGAELSPKERGVTGKSEVTLDSLVWAIVSITIAGLGVIIGLMAVMKRVLNFPDGLIIAFTFLSFLAFLGADSVFIWLLLRSRRSDKDDGPMIRWKGLPTSDLDDKQARALPEPASSVTGNTTRTLETARQDRKME